MNMSWKKENIKIKSHFYANVAALLTLIIGFLISVTIYMEIDQAENSRFLAEFNSRAGNLAATLQNGIRDNLQAISAISSWFVAEKKSGVYEDIDMIRKEFHAFAPMFWPSIQA